MTTASKLWLGFGSLLVLLAATSLIIFIQVGELREATQRLTTQVQPLSAVAYDMEVNTNGMGLGVMQYQQTPVVAARAQVARDAREFLDAKARYDKLTTTATYRLVGGRLNSVFRDYRRLGEALMQQRDTQETIQGELAASFAALDGVISNHALRASDRLGAGSAGKAIEATSMRAAIAEVGTWLMNYRRTGNPDYRTRLFASAVGFNAAAARFTALQPGAPGLDWVGELTAGFDRAMAQVNETLALQATQQARTEEFLRVHGEMEDILHGQVQRLTGNDMQRSRAAVANAERTIFFTLIALLAGGLLIGGGIAVPVGRWIVSAENRLRQSRDDLELRVRDRTADLAASNAALTRSNQELETFAYVASHDLQEPLRKIQAFGDRLQARQGEALTEQGRDYLARMQSAAERMRALINDLLAFSRVTSKFEAFAPVDLAVVAREVVADLETRVAAGGGRVDIGALPVIDAEPLQIRQLLQNLIANGLKFHRPGVPPIVRVAARIVEADAAPAMCEISVQDNGIGFEEIYLDRIFQVFQRLHGRTAYEGTGIGLAICRKIVERHGGTITARSAPDQGATFIATLPVRQQHSEMERTS